MSRAWGKQKIWIPNRICDKWKNSNPVFKSASDFSVKRHSRCKAGLMKHFKTMKYHPNYVRNLRRSCVKKAWKISQDWTGFQPMTSMITVQCSYHWVIKPTGSWSLGEFVKISKVDQVGIHNSSHRSKIWHFIYSLKKMFCRCERGSCLPLKSWKQL